MQKSIRGILLANNFVKLCKEEKTRMAKQKYSKSSEFYTNAKKSFFEQNETLDDKPEQKNKRRQIRQNIEIVRENSNKMLDADKVET